MSNIKDVAKMANVSVATVSRVINNCGNVSDESRESVIRAVRELSYRPNLLGRNLRRTETNMILVLLPTIANPFFTKIVKGIEDIAKKNGYHIMLCNTESDINREKIYIDLLKNRLADGVIFIAPELSREELSQLGSVYPVVQCTEYKEGAKVSHVSIDDHAAAYTATKHLISLGHTKIGLISCNNNFVSTKKREEGYRKALSEHEIPFSEKLISYGGYGFKSGLRGAMQLLSQQNRPTAIFAISDMMAIGAMKAIKNAGCRVGKDIAVVGFDNVSFSSMIDPMLTTIAQPMNDLGGVAMEILLRQIKGENREPENVVLEHELIIRESTVK